MKALSGVVNSSGSFPNVIAVDKSGPSATDGTAVQSLWMSEVFSMAQAVLNAASITPSGTTDTCGATAGDVTGSQFFEALQLALAVPGEIVGYPSDTIPTGARLLKLSGQVVSLTTYPRLEHVYCGDSANPSASAYYKTSDSGGTTRSTSGTYLKLPDYRGLFLRGRDPAGTWDPIGDSREIGDIQGDTLEQHYHDKIYLGASEVETVTLKAFSAGLDTMIQPGASGLSLKTGDVDGGSGVDTETRPINTVVVWCIRY